MENLQSPKSQIAEEGVDVDIPTNVQTLNEPSTQSYSENPPLTSASSIAPYSKLLKTLLINSIPSMLYLASLFFVITATLHFVGLENDTSLYDGTALGFSTLYCFSIYFTLSLNMGLTALASQAHGSGLNKLVGLYLHRNIINNLMISAIVYWLLYFSNDLLVLIGIPSNIASIAAYFLKYSQAIVFGMIFYDSIKCYLYAIEVFIPQFIISVALAIIHWFTCDYFIVTQGLGIKGVVITMAISIGLGNILMFTYVSISRRRSPSWFWFQKESFKELFSLFKRELPIAAMVYFEWVIFHIMIFMSTRLPENEMAAFVTLGTLQSLMYVIPLGLSITITSLVGNAIGEQNKQKTVRMIKVALCTGIVILGLVMIIFWFNRQAIGAFYTSDPEVQAPLESLFEIYIYAMPADFIQSILSGIIKGIGKEKLGSISFMIVFYGIGLPSSSILCFVFGYNSRGLWIGMTIALYSLVLVFIVILKRTSIDQQILLVKNRLSVDQGKIAATTKA